MLGYILVCISLICVVNSQNVIGSPCTLDGFPGRCVEMKTCYYLFETFKLAEKPQVCPSDGDVPLVCCTDCDLVDDINDITIDPQRGPLHKNGRKSWDYCLDSLKNLPYPCKESYVFFLQKDWAEDKKCHDIRYTATGGTTAEKIAKRIEFPHMALLGYGDDLNSLNWVCGGTIISERFILTAGHCTSNPMYGLVKYAALGIRKRSDPEGLWKRHIIQDNIPHPQYKAPSKYHDIALLRTAESIQFSESVLPACLPSENTKIDLHEYAFAPGWGALEHQQELVDTVKIVTVSKFSNEDCSAIFKPNRKLKNGFNERTQLCYGHKNETDDTCVGVSGEPLHINNGCAFDVIGVTSYSHPCGSEGQAGVYTRVEHYVPWIESVVWP